MREVYAERRAALLEALESELGGAVEVVGAKAGLDLALWLPRGVDDGAVVRALAAERVEAATLSSHALRPLPRGGLLLGFAAFAPARLRAGVQVLARVLPRLQRRAASRTTSR
jgi:GntR family transcriptional regulator/MocR family aminotransferase